MLVIMSPFPSQNEAKAFLKDYFGPFISKFKIVKTILNFDS